MGVQRELRARRGDGNKGGGLPRPGGVFAGGGKDTAAPFLRLRTYPGKKSFLEHLGEI